MNKKVMLVRNLRDLTVLVNRNTEFLTKELNKLQKGSRKFKVLAGLAVVCAAVSEYKRGQMEEELYRLNVRLKKLERREEE